MLDVTKGPEVWEVKPDQVWWTSGEGQEQLDTYIQARNRNGILSIPGGVYHLTGSFIVVDGLGPPLLVRYGEPGMLYYRRLTVVPVPVPVPVEAPAPQRQERRDPILVPVP